MAAVLTSRSPSRSLSVAGAAFLTQSVGGDTVLVQLGQSGLLGATAVAIIVASVVLVLLLAALMVALIQTRRLIGTADQLSRRLGDRAEPIMERGRAIAESVEFIARSLRTDVERVSATVANLSDRLDRAADAVEQRVEDFNALLHVMQGEAEDLFLDTASTVRGVRAGMRTLRRRDTAKSDGRDDESAAGAELTDGADDSQHPAVAGPVAEDPERVLPDR